MYIRICMTTLAEPLIIIIVSLLVALAVGLLLRYLLVRRLKKTVLDNWLIQIFGFLIIIPPIIVGIIAAGYFTGIPASDMLSFLEFFIPFDTTNVGQLVRHLAFSVLIFLLAIGVGRTLLK